MNKNTIITIFIILIISISIGYAYLETDLNINSNIHVKSNKPEIIYYLNNIKQNNIPTKSEDYTYDDINSTCTNNATPSWDNDNWKVNINNITKKPTCNIYFIKVNKCSEDTCNFNYTGTYQIFIAPKDGTYKVELWGSSNSQKFGNGRGGYTNGNILLKENEKMYLYIGRQGLDKTDNRKAYNYGYHNYRKDSGGSSDIRLIRGNWDNFNSLKSRIMVSAGAGGAGGLNTDDTGNPYGGNAGGLKGYKGGTAISKGETPYPGSDGATQTSGQDFGKVLDTYDHKNPITSVWNVNGGNGYFSGNYYNWLKFNGHQGVSGAGGGSSYISGHNGCVAITENSTKDNIIQRKDSNGNTCTDGTTDVTCSYHYLGYVFTNTIMIDGAGYNWTTEKGQYTGQPQPDGTTATGHSGNGYARITYLGN